jgi:hypothetical protein
MAVIVDLAPPHADDGVGLGASEPVDLLCMMSKMMFQRCPLRSDRQLHGFNSRARSTLYVPKRTIALRRN